MTFIQQSWLSFKGMYAVYSKEEFLAGQLLPPIMSMIFFCILASYSFSTSNLTNWVIGNSFLLASNVCVFSLGFFLTSDRYYGRLKYIFLSDRPIFISLLEKSFFSIVCSAFVVIGGIILGTFLFHTQIKANNLSILIICVFITIFSTAMFGIFLSTFGLFSDNIQLILNTAYTLLLIFTGVNFPLEYLPDFLQKIVHLLPMTNSLQGIQLILSRGEIGKGISFVTGEFLVGIGYFILSIISIKYVGKIALKSNTLELF